MKTHRYLIIVPNGVGIRNFFCTPFIDRLLESGSVAREFQRNGEIVHGKSAGAKQQFNHAMKTGLNGTFKQRSPTIPNFIEMKGPATRDPILKRKKSSTFNQRNQLREFVWQRSNAAGHVPELRQLSDSVKPRGVAWTATTLMR